MTVTEKLELAERLTHQANDYRDIYNTISAQMYYLQVQQHRELVEHCWSDRDDVSFGPAKGQEAVLDFLIRQSDARKRENLELAHKYHGVEMTEDNLGVGDLESRLAANPYIVIAADRKTAQGVWFSPAVKAEIGEDGELHGVYMQERISVDFIRENDQWRIWHYNVYPDFTTALPDETFDDSRYEGRTFDEEGAPNEDHTNKMPEGSKVDGNRPMPYCAESIPVWKPPLPEEYSTWTEFEDMPIM